MPGLSYPFVYECSNCGAKTTVTRDDARGLHPDPDSLDALDVVLEQRGWMRDELEGLLWCSACIPSDGHDEGQIDQEDTSHLNAFSGRYKAVCTCRGHPFAPRQNALSQPP